MTEAEILDDVNKGSVTSVVTGNPIAVRSLLGGVTEEAGRILKAEVGLTFQPGKKLFNLAKKNHRGAFLLKKCAAQASYFVVFGSAL